MEEDSLRGYAIADYATGSLMKVELTNFLTYDHAIYYPSPNLNVIIGSNGTGKSSLLCGICFAVGGKPENLGRSSRMSDYVKHGKKEASVEVTMRDDCPAGFKRLKVQVKKSAGKHDSVTEHFIDDRKVTHQQLMELTTGYDIQIANPCTFLAQDKVKSFSEQNAQQLLENTQKAFGRGIYEKYIELVAESREGDDVVQIVKRLETDLERNRRCIADLEPRVQSYEERQSRSVQINKLKKLAAFLEAEKALEKYRGEVAAKKEKDDELKKKSRAEEKLKVKAQLLQQKIQRQRDNCVNQMESVRHFEHEIKDLMRGSRTDEEIAANQRQFDELQRSHEEWSQLKTQKEEELKGFRENAEEARRNYVPKDFSQEDRALRQDREKLHERKRQFQQKHEVLKNKERRLEHQKHAAQNARRTKLRCLTQQRALEHLDIQRAWEFYEQNKDRFRYPVHIPYMDVIIKDTAAPKFFCSTVGIRDMGMFIFGCQEDEQLMHSQRFKINSTVLTEAQVRRYVAERISMSDRMRRLGFQKFLADMIEAPEEVLAFLYSNSSINTIPIGSNALNENLEDVAGEIANEHPLLFTPSFRCYTKYSWITNEPITRLEELRNTGALGYFVDDHLRTFSSEDSAERESLAREMEALQREHLQFNEGLRTMNEKIEKLQEAKKEEARQKNLAVSLMQRVQRLEAELQFHIDNVPDMENGRRDFERQKKICKQNALERNEQLVKAVEKCSKKLLELATGTDVVAEEEAQLYVHQEKLEVLASEIRLLKEALTELAEAYQQADGAFQRCNEHFMEVCEISSIDPSKLRSTREKRKLQELAETFEKEDITRDSEALELQITQEIAKLQVSGVVGTENDVVRHREALSDKERIEAELQEKMQAMNNNAAQLSAKLDAWKNPVSQLVDKISENFKKFFTQLECIGEVKLNVPEREYDMEQYGIDIYVKFRENAELRRLDDKSQSGGERSVSTMLYMLALQELCPVPFRCVDEINQGMDPRNERKVFEMMLDILASEGSLAKTQYFLLTPKLLPGLRYNEKVRVGIIFNSPLVVRDNVFKESLVAMLASDAAVA